jgi:hypothetical protein
MSGRFAIDRQVALYGMGGLVLALGLFGLVAARSLGFTEAPGVEVVDVTADFMWGRQLAFNPLGALCVVGVGVATLAAAATRLRWLAVGTAVVALGLALLTTLQLGRDDQILGSRAGNVALLVAASVTLLVLALTPSASGADSSE